MTDIYINMAKINFASDNIALFKSIFTFVYSVILPACRSSILIKHNEYSRVIARTVTYET